ncbi:rhomboid family intramembrane serine protease [Pedobacter psychrophilus]|uniref:Rhomboid family intramembrane serine protease n=1 Tax=Pedobacter psychrophilus TaxID=1826909 RepID=A0A179DDS4_9SPHI|nr:rhomboid family intramembrane serine protease [Pedobacter psychrophilus]OAQ38850.1 rhomboid family intramembrane serine protease [Pedobacter psychrophilus]
MGIFDEIKMKMLNSGSRVMLFIGINVIIFLLTGILTLFTFLFKLPIDINALVTNYLAVPTYLPTLLYRFWTPFTYMFLHAGFFHILFNMLWLFWMGKILEEFLNAKKLTFVYIAGGLAGAVFYILCYNIFPAFAEAKIGSVAVGASASVTAIMVATATLLPNYTIGLMFIGPVKLKWLVLAFILLDLINVAGPNSGGYISHLGGGIFGFFFIRALQSGNDWSKPYENVFKPKLKLKVVSKNDHVNFRPKNDIPNQEMIDQILDKISQSGYNNLTKREKDILFNASKNHEEKEK